MYSSRNAAVADKANDAPRRLLEGYVDGHNNVRLNSATGYITPKDMLAGRREQIQAARDRKREAGRRLRESAVLLRRPEKIAVPCHFWNDSYQYPRGRGFWQPWTG